MTVLYSSCSTKFKNQWLEDGKGKLQTIIFERAETSPNTMFHDLTFIFKYCQKEIQQKRSRSLGSQTLWSYSSSLTAHLLSPPFFTSPSLYLPPTLPNTSNAHTETLSILYFHKNANIWKRFICILKLINRFSSVQSLSRVQLCDPMNRSTPGLPVHHQLLEFTQTHVHQVSDAIQPSHPLSSPSPPAPNPSQHQSLSQWVNSSHEVAKVFGVSALASFLPKNTQHRSPLEWTGWVSLQSKGLSRVFSNTTIQRHQFFSTQLSSQSNSHIHTWPQEKL